MSGTQRRKSLALTLGGALSGTVVGKGVAEYVLVVDPSGISSLIVIAIFFLIGAAAGACGYQAAQAGSGNGN